MNQDFSAYTFLKTVFNDRRNDIHGDYNRENYNGMTFAEKEISRNILVCFIILIVKVLLAFTTCTDVLELSYVADGSKEFVETP